MSSNGFENLAAKISFQPSFITCGLYYNSIYDRKNYDASYDRTSGVGIYDASVVIYDASSVNYDAKFL